MLFSSIQENSKPRRVVITGAGIVTALGVGWAANAEGFRAGRRAFQEITLFDVSRQRVKTGAQVELLGGGEIRAGRRIHPGERALRMLLLAAREAWGMAGDPAPKTTPVVLATTSGGMAYGEEFYRVASAAVNSRRGQPTRVVQYLAQAQAGALRSAMGMAGPTTVVSNACAAGSNAVGLAWEAVRSGQAERALAAGHDALSQLVFAGFDALQALSPTVCRPFDTGRDGLALGEGAGALVLESLESATERGATILGEMVGYGAATDIHHLTQPNPSGEAALRSMRAACDAAGIPPETIDYINAHGTGTLMNDQAETAAIHAWMRPGAPPPFVSSTKSSIGHLLGAAGVVEAIVCLMALREQFYPPTSTLREADADTRFRLVGAPLSAAQAGRPIQYALSNSFGFGGANATVVFRRWP